MTEENESTVKEVEIEVAGQIELPVFPIEDYVGKKAKLIKPKTMEGKHGFFIKVETESLGIYNDKPVIASRIFGLQTDTEGKIGWGESTQLGKYLAKLSVTHFNELEGKEVLITSKENKSTLKDYLSF